MVWPPTRCGCTPGSKLTVSGWANRPPLSCSHPSSASRPSRTTRGSLNQVRFTVHDLKNEAAPCGLTSLTVDHQVRTAEFLILLAPEVRGHGLATEATRLTLDYAFHLTALAQVWLKVLEPNTAAIRAYEHAGFHLAGRLRQAGYWHGQRCDELLMDALTHRLPWPVRRHPPLATIVTTQ
jgi:RimJ/RimL family protein N-acetyltransferase